MEALPADYGAAGRDAYLRHRPLIMTALPEIEALVPKAALAARFLIGLVDSDLAAGVITTRRRIAEAILDKAAAEPAWRERLVTDPAATLRDDPIGGMIASLSTQSSDYPCTQVDTQFPPFSCILSCILSDLVGDEHREGARG
ncbi:MAG: hypothetical protein E6G94_10365 [Alphaproteobacteria bacterium]|nr:MAG: hypothetical protein E6G94_10365 [Alphaproteobacteria bacterium]